MQLNLAWWNTSLSPPIPENRSTNEQKEFALGVVRHLICELGVDFLALGEVASSDLEYFQTHLNLDNYAIYDGTGRTGRLISDIGAIYNSQAFAINNTEQLGASKANRNYKLAHRLDMLFNNGEQPLHIFISHWPSRISCQKNHEDRPMLGIRLRDAVNAVMETYESTASPANIILFGDYNDEPFDSSLSDHLWATRDRGQVRRNPKLLYNPFWRHLGEAIPYIRGDSCDRHGGSCYYSAGWDTHWNTFDQIMFSAAFVGNGQWHLNEESTGILNFSSFIEGEFRRDIFDHFPVVSVIEMEVPQNG